MSEIERGQARIKTVITKEENGKHRQYADLTAEHWPYLFKVDTSPVVAGKPNLHHLVYLPRYPAIFRASRNPEEHCAAWNRAYADQPVAKSPVTVLGRAYPVKVIHEALGSRPPAQPPRAPVVRRKRPAVYDHMIEASFAVRDGQIVWRERTRETLDALGLTRTPAEVAVWNAQFAGKPVRVGSGGRVALAYHGVRISGSGLENRRTKALVQGTVALQQIAAGKDPRDDEVRSTREKEAITRRIQAAQAEPEEAARALRRVDEAMASRERVAWVRVEDIAAVVGGKVEVPEKRGYERKGLTRERRQEMFAAAFFVLFRRAYWRHPWQKGWVMFTDGNPMIVPEFVEVDEEGWDMLAGMGFFDDGQQTYPEIKAGRRRQWNARQVGKSFGRGQIKLGRVRISFEELLACAPDGPQPPATVRMDLWEKVADGYEEWQAWMKVKAMGF